MRIPGNSHEPLNQKSKVQSYSNFSLQRHSQENIQKIDQKNRNLTQTLAPSLDGGPQQRRKNNVKKSFTVLYN